MVLLVQEGFSGEVTFDLGPKQGAGASQWLSAENIPGKGDEYKSAVKASKGEPSGAAAVGQAGKGARGL